MIVRQVPFSINIVYLCCQGTFRDRVHVTVSETLHEIISSLMTSDSEDIRFSVIAIISDLVTKGSIMDPSPYVRVVSDPGAQLTFIPPSTLRW
jgi:hypothetical protein